MKAGRWQTVMGPLKCYGMNGTMHCMVLTFSLAELGVAWVAHRTRTSWVRLSATSL